MQYWPSRFFSSLAAGAVSSLLLVAPLHAQMSNDTFFFKEYFSVYPYYAIALPRPTHLEPGAIVSANLIPERHAADCYDIQDPNDFHPFTASLLQLTLSTSNMQTTVMVETSGVFSGEASVDIRREDVLAEENLGIVKQQLAVSERELAELVLDTCRDSLHWALDGDNGLFVVAEVFTFEGDLNATSSLSTAKSGRAKISTESFLSAISSIPFVSTIMDKLRFELGASFENLDNNVQTILRRFETRQAGQIYDYIAYVPLRISRQGAERIKEVYREREEDVNEVLSGTVSPAVFVSENPEFDAENEESLLFDLFNSDPDDPEDSVFYTPYVTEMEDQSLGAQISALHVIDFLADRFN